MSPHSVQNSGPHFVDCRPEFYPKYDIFICNLGIAALTCAETLRQNGYKDRIQLITKENCLPYNRKSLSKAVCLPHEDRLLRSEKFYYEYGIEVLMGRNVRSIEPESKSVIFEDGNSQSYTKLVLAMGAVNRRLNVPGADLDGIFYLRTLNDAKEICKESTKKHVTIIGSGFMGMELACAVSKVASSVSVFGKAASPLTILGSDVGKEIRKYMESEGITVRQETVVRCVEGYDQLSSLVLKDGMCVAAQTVIAAIGLMPCTSILIGSKIQTDPTGYVLVDERMRTNQPNIYACGDLTNFPIEIYPHARHRANLPHWQVAQYQGRMAALSILRKIEKITTFVPFLWIRLFDKHITFSGDPTLEPDERICEGSLLENNYTSYFIKNNYVVGVLSCGGSNLAVQFIEVFRKRVKITKEEVLRNKEHIWKNFEVDEKLD